MDNAFWGLLGTAVGGVLALAGNLLSTRLQLKTQAQHEGAQRRQAERDLRRICYLQLLDTARRLRFAARAGRDHSVNHRDELGTTLSRLVYEVEMTSSDPVVQAAQHLAGATRDYVRLGVALGDETDQAKAEEVSRSRVIAREAADKFIQAARLELEQVTDATT
jgi:hypothetical protein